MGSIGVRHLNVVDGAHSVWVLAEQPRDQSLCTLGCKEGDLGKWKFNSDHCSLHPDRGLPIRLSTSTRMASGEAAAISMAAREAYGKAEIHSVDTIQKDVSWARHCLGIFNLLNSILSLNSTTRGGPIQNSVPHICTCPVSVSLMCLYFISSLCGWGGWFGLVKEHAGGGWKSPASPLHRPTALLFCHPTAPYAPLYPRPNPPHPPTLTPTPTTHTQTTLHLPPPSIYPPTTHTHLTSLPTSHS